MINFKPPRLAVSCLLAMFCLAGCDKAPKLNTYPAGGKLTYKGAPVTDAQVVFHAVNRESGKNATAKTDAEGRFKLETFVGGSTTAEGALAGEYVVCVTKINASMRDQVKNMPGAPAMPGGAMPDFSTMSEEEQKKHAANSPEKLREKYGEIKGDEDRKKIDEFKPDMTQMSDLPAKYMDPAKSDLRFTVKAGDPNQFEFDLPD
jgi:hypothetical protein